MLKSVQGSYTKSQLKNDSEFEKYKMYGIDTSRDKSRDFDLMSLTYLLTLTVIFSPTIEKIY
jgi:hypothetical protein